jgi:hypothetical protein
MSSALNMHVYLATQQINTIAKPEAQQQTDVDLQDLGSLGSQPISEQNRSLADFWDSAVSSLQSPSDPGDSRSSTVSVSDGRAVLLAAVSQDSTSEHPSEAQAWQASSAVDATPQKRSRVAAVTYPKDTSHWYLHHPSLASLLSQQEDIPAGAEEESPSKGCLIEFQDSKLELRIPFSNCMQQAQAAPAGPLSLADPQPWARHGASGPGASSALAQQQLAWHAEPERTTDASPLAQQLAFDDLANVDLDHPSFVLFCLDDLVV